MQTTYILVGRVCDYEDHVKSVRAESEKQAQEKFEFWVRREEGVLDEDHEFYIEHCSTIEQLIDHSAPLMLDK